MNIKFIRKRNSYVQVIFFILFVNIIPSEAYNDSLQTYISFPKPYKEHEFNQSIGVSVTVLPRSVFEDAYSQLPMIYYKARYGLPYNFSANGRFNTVIFTNQASIGLMWSYNFNDYYIAAAYEWGQWFGFMESEGLSIKSRGSLNYPSISLGHQFDKVRLTLKGELMIQTQKTAVDGLAIGQSFNGISGYAISAIIEQPLWKNHTVLGEIKLNFNKFHYQTWLSYSTFNSFILYPEIIFGFNL